MIVKKINTQSSALKDDDNDEEPDDDDSRDQLTKRSATELQYKDCLIVKHTI